MGNYASTKAEIRNYIKARVPFIVIDSSERERAERMLRELAREMDIQIPYYTDARQVVMLGGSGVEDAERDPMTYIAATFRKKRGVTFAIGDGRRMDEDHLYAREMLDILYLAAEQSCTLIVITPECVWPRLTNFGMIAKLDYPDLEERSRQIVSFTEKYRGRFPISWGDEDVMHASVLLRGFTEMQIENVLSSEIMEHGRLQRENLNDLTRQKCRLYSAVPCVSQVNVPPEMGVSGLQNLKKWLDEKKKIFFLPDDVLRRRDIAPPKGILLTGIPGCGKSYSAKMAAKQWEMPLFRFDIGGIYDKWVGESERRMRDALRFIDNVAPCVVWIDEIEKALSVSDDGNDTGKRVLGQFLFWLQESDSRVFLVATANDITKLAPELFRKGRFSEIFFIDLPNRAERREAIEQYGARSLSGILDADTTELLADISEGFSFADIEHAIKEAAQEAILSGDDAVTPELLQSLFAESIPYARTNPDSVERLRAWGVSHAVSASVPDK